MSKTVELPVRYRDTDSQGHMYFANYLVFADEALGEYWHELGWNFEDVGQIPALTFAVNANVDYIGECLCRDRLSVTVKFSRLGNSSADTAWEIHNQRTGELAAKGSFTHVFVDKATRKSTPIPSEFRARITARQPELA